MAALAGKGPFTPFILANKEKILPLLGEEDVANLLHEQSCDLDIYAYERIKHQVPGITAELKTHQLDGISFLLNLWKNKAHGILADEMGLGKTLQTLGLFQMIKNMEEDGHQPFLVVCPMSVLSNWQTEIERWTSLKAVQWYGDCEKRKHIALMVKRREFDVVLTTYETVVSENFRLVRMGLWEVVVLDEGHRIKNASTRLSRCVQSLKAKQRIVVTGTPIQNDLSELWSLCHWLYPEIFVKETLQYWKEAFCLSSGTVDSTFLKDVREFLKIIMIRRLKQSTSEGLKLPVKKEIVLHLPLTKEQKTLYLEVITGKSESVNEESSHFMPTPPHSPRNENFPPSHFMNQSAKAQGSGRSITNVLMDLRKICVHPLLVENVGVENADIELMSKQLVNASSKFVALQKLLYHEVVLQNKKMLIFSGFDRTLECCQLLLESMDIGHLRLDGRTPYAQRKLNVHLFQERNDHQVFVIATRAGGEGITLTAAEIVVFMDIDFNPSVMAQAGARAHRIGQTKPVTIVKLCTRGTIEEQMLDRVSRKLYLASRVISDATSANSEMATAESFDSDGTFIQRLISSSFASVTADPFAADDLSQMDWKEILKSFAPSSPNTPNLFNVDSFEHQENNWLSQSARIKTGVFDGKIFSRLRASFKHDTPIDLDPSLRRLGKNTTVYDAEIDYYVSKESTFCKYGEAVPTTTSGNTAKVKKVSGTGFQHLKTCMICDQTGSLEKCIYCPEAFHKQCGGRQKESSKNSPFCYSVCTKHSCIKCGLTANKAGGLLLSCTDCPSAYCIECVDLKTMDAIDGEPLKYEVLGYLSPQHIQYITCGDCVRRKQEKKRKWSPCPSDLEISKRGSRAL